MGIVFIRHAEVARKYQNRYLGHSDIGIDKNHFKRDKVTFLKSRNFDFVYSSSLKRARQTLDIMGYSYQIDKRLNEVMFKDEIELKSFEEIEKLCSFKRDYLKSKKSWHQYICLESLEDFKMRIESFISDLPQNKEILICTHGGILREISGHNMGYLESYELY